MFIGHLTKRRKQVGRQVNEDRRASPRFELPIFVRQPGGTYLEHYGKVGINGFYFETEKRPLVGQQISIKLILHGLGIEIETSGKVTKIFPEKNHVGVAVRFEEMPFEIERLIARWLDLVEQAFRLPQNA